MKLQTTSTRPVKLAFLAFVGSGLCLADKITFSVVPESGTINVAPLQTVGWGYSIENNSNYYLLPIALSDSGVLYGALSDIFDYPVVDPAQMAYQSYIYNAPGGFGNSLGLFEYTAPGDLPIALHQTGTFTLTYQLYSGNPDLDPSAFAIGDPEMATVGFDLGS